MKRLSRLLMVLVVVGGVLVFIGVGGIRDNLQPVLPYDTVTADQVKKGAVISGEVKMNLGNFAEEYNTENGVKSGSSSYYYAIMVGDKVMALHCGNTNEKNILDTQANALTSNLSSWSDVAKVVNGESGSEDQDTQKDTKKDTKKNSKKNAKKNKKSDTEKEEQTSDDSAMTSSVMPVKFKGVVKKLDSDVLKYFNEYLTPTGASEPVLEILPYEVSLKMSTMGMSVGFTVGGLVLLLIPVLIFLKMRR